MRIDKQTIFEIHRLKDLGWSDRKVSRHLRIGRPSVSKYHENPDHPPLKRKKYPSKLHSYRDLVKDFLDQDPDVKAPVVMQRLQKEDFNGKITIVRDYLLELRGQRAHRTPFIRFESPEEKQFQIDWGHFGYLQYGDTRRKLYALAVIESLAVCFMSSILIA